MLAIFYSAAGDSRQPAGPNEPRRARVLRTASSAMQSFGSRAEVNMRLHILAEVDLNIGKRIVCLLVECNDSVLAPLLKTGDEIAVEAEDFSKQQIWPRRLYLLNSRVPRADQAAGPVQTARVIVRRMQEVTAYSKTNLHFLVSFCDYSCPDACFKLSASDDRQAPLVRAGDIVNITFDWHKVLPGELRIKAFEPDWDASAGGLEPVRS